MGKKVIVVLVGIDKAQVPQDLTDEQFIDLTGDPEAYRRLKEGLKRAGLDPTSFPFPPDRRPYPGFAYLEEEDAAVFFGRDAQIVRALDDIRRLARTGVTRMFVILGASGSGKSSFLRAGLWPRLKRDDRAWLPLPIVRPRARGDLGGLWSRGVARPDRRRTIPSLAIAIFRSPILSARARRRQCISIPKLSKSSRAWNRGCFSMAASLPTPIHRLRCFWPAFCRPMV